MKNTLTVRLLIAMLFFSLKLSATAKISGNYPSLNEGDVVTLITDVYGSPNFTGFQSAVSCLIKNHRFNFFVNTESIPVRFSLTFKSAGENVASSNAYSRKVLHGYYIEEGDNINIAEKDGQINFSGPGSEKYKIIQQLNINETLFFHNLGESFEENPELNLRKQDSVFLYNSKYLDSRRTLLSENIYELLRSDLIGQWYARYYELNQMLDSEMLPFLQKLKDYKPEATDPSNRINELRTNPILSYSERYTLGIYHKYLYDSCNRVAVPFNTRQYYHYIKDNYSGQLCERLITNVLYYRRNEPEDNADLVKDALTWVTNDDFKSILGNLKASRIHGASAGNFKLVDDHGRQHITEEYKGKIVFIDFWFTGCGNCIRVKPYIESLENKYKNKEVVFLSINVDKKKAQWIKSIQSGRYTTKQGINLFGGEQGLMSPIGKYYSVDGGPTLILIDKRGKLMVSPVDPRFDDGRNICNLINKELGI